MIEGLKPYAQYKESGLAWVPKIPTTWETARNGNLFQQRNETHRSELPVLEVSLRTGVRVRDFDTSKRKQVMADFGKYKRAAAGDIAYNMMRMWQGAVGVAPVDGLVSPAYVVARPFPNTKPSYYASLFRMGLYMGEIDAVSRGIVKDRNRLYWDQFKQMRSLLPPPDEQLAIVRFLDHANRKIAGFIRAKRKLIGLLNEQKQAIIHRAVTRGLPGVASAKTGLDPNAKLKPSGIPWLGEIPAHWEVTSLRRHWRVTDCKHLTVPFVEDGIPLASVREVQSFTLNLSRSKKTTPSWYRMLIDGNRKPMRGDLIYCRNASVGACALVETEIDFAMGQDVCLIRSQKQNQRFLNYLLHSPFMDHQLELLLVGSTFKRINVADIKGLTVVVPLREEQDAICEYLDSNLSIFTTAIARTEREIALMQEYRTRLTADIVTGKLDVREAAAKLPDLPVTDGAVPDDSPLDSEDDSEEDHPSED